MRVAQDNTPVAQNLRRIIQEKGMKQGAVAQRAGYDPQQLSDMIRGRKIIRPIDIAALAKALRVEIKDLFSPG